jgi:tRNA dimethylallyltransferase
VSNPEPTPIGAFDPAALDPARPVLIAGPTASGKSALARAVAEAGGGVIVNADALKVYGCWRVLTARPTASEEAGFRHALYGHVPCERPYSVGDWLRDVRDVARRAEERLIVVGGTGLYFRALTEGLADIPPVPAAIRAEAEARLAGDGAAALLAELDRETAARIDCRNPVRVRRAWEVLQATGRGLAEWQDATAAPLLPLAEAQPLLIEAGRDGLAARIAARFHAMLKAGALAEVAANRDVLARGGPAAQAIGAAALAAHLDGQLTLDQAADAAIAATRQYAKRQRTWFRARMAGWRLLATPQAGRARALG